MEILFPETIDLSYPEHYVFMIKVHPEQFSFTLHELGNENLDFYYEIPKNKSSDAFSDFKQIFFENPVLASSFRKIYVLNDTSEFIFIPNFLYEKHSDEELMKFNFPHFSGELLSQKIHQPEMTIIHQMSKDIYQFLTRSFVNPHFIHHLSPLVSYFQGKNRVLNFPVLIINIWKKDLDILCFSHGDFMFGNHFKIQQIQEAVYYVLFIWKQLKLDQSKDFIQICGNNDQQAELKKELKPFVQNITTVNISSTDQSIPFELLSLISCEL